jgi:AcrR family transcriptional regulator
VLDSARTLFAERGFERTTIRAVAGAAGVDPALVMQYFGSKRDLFTRAVVTGVETPGTVADSTALVDRMLDSLGLKLGGLPEGALATVRSMLTDPAAADHARALLGTLIDGITASLPAQDEDGRVRAALLASTVLGVTIAHQLLALPALEGVPTERITALLRPALLRLAENPDEAADPAG